MFVLSGKSVTIEPRMLHVPQFKKIWNRDNTKNKSKATKEFAYIYFMVDYQSEYNAFGLDKEVMVSKEIFGIEDYTPDQLVIDAMERYEQFQQTHSMRYLKSVRDTVDTLILHYDDLRNKLLQEDTANKDASLILKAMKEVETILDKIEKWEKKVAGEEDDMKIRGGGKPGMFEDPELATWIQRK